VLDWLAPWTAFRYEVMDAEDHGVLNVIRILARLDGSAQEVNMIVAWILTVRDGKLTRAEVYADKAEALEAVALAG
jgi:ketosteroid isomerase-like protein